MQMSVVSERVLVGHKLLFGADRKSTVMKRRGGSTNETQQPTDGRLSTDTDKTAPGELSRTLG